MDLREQAINAIANYMHDELFKAIPVNMLGFIRDSAEQLVQGCDRAIAATIEESKKMKLVSPTGEYSG